MQNKKKRSCEGPCSSTGPQAAHRREAQGWDGEAVPRGAAGLRVWRGGGGVEAAGLQRVLESGGTLVAVSLAVSCFNKDARTVSQL